MSINLDQFRPNYYPWTAIDPGGNLECHMTSSEDTTDFAGPSETAVAIQRGPEQGQLVYIFKNRRVASRP